MGIGDPLAVVSRPTLSSFGLSTLRVDVRGSLALIGKITKYLSVPLAIPLLFALYEGVDVMPFAVTLALVVAVGAPLERVSSDTEPGTREGYLIVALTWLVLPVVGAIPFVLAGNGVIADPVNALFESMSGTTTTGATVIVDFDAHSRPIMLWRSLIQWLGGLSILVIAVAVLSELSVGGAQLMETETATTSVRKLTPRIEGTARLLGTLYLGLTVAAVAGVYALHLAGLAPEMTLFDAVNHAFTSISTSGFSPRADSIAAFSPAVQWAYVPVMFVGATNFVIIYRVTRGKYDAPLRSEEFRVYVGIVAFLSLLVAGLLLVEPHQQYSIEETLRHATFQVVSILTTTGYASTNFDLWSPSAKNVLFLCMFFGGMVGSTTCSIKLLRWLVIVKSLRRDIFTAVHPSAVRPVRLDEGIVDEDSIRQMYAYTMLNLVIFACATVFVIVDAARVGLSLTELEALGASAATFLNIGPGFGLAGPFGSYVEFPATTKLVMVVLMWVGRIEIIPVLVLLTRTYWRD
ncbi:TrkH family potassium uptake protein [Haloprofundus sp. MHR1]|uniref:TrkH family potassium uptake protein n=1 Tax=Haloprofundus sp. MHR1 TaxID=2572921 RepID=UPI0010BF41B4|nr:TrkH family potassium uptake protein [Haloprofundus sp. MHR1]QCJ48547.1 TrkH family potassium uptake protein [Haloprofundus sp. MHR1]